MIGSHDKGTRVEEKWKTLGSKTLLKDRWIDVRADECVTPGGRDISPYYVLSYPDWIHIVAITPDDCMVLVRQYRHAAGEFLTEIPAGGVDKADTDIEQTARRELEEETGFTSRTWKRISTLYANPATHTNRVHTFLALDAERTGEQRLDQGEEGLTVQVVPVDRVLAGMTTGMIEQAMQVSSVLLALNAAGYPR